MEGDPFVLIEGMTIAALAVGASRGYIYLRSEYPHALPALQQAIAIAYETVILAIRGGSGKRSIWKFGWARARTSAAKRRRCSKAWKASAGRSDPSRRCRRSKDCSQSRPL